MECRPSSEHFVDVQTPTGTKQHRSSHSIPLRRGCHSFLVSTSPAVCQMPSNHTVRQQYGMETQHATRTHIKNQMWWLSVTTLSLFPPPPSTAVAQYSSMAINYLLQLYQRYTYIIIYNYTTICQLYLSVSFLYTELDRRGSEEANIYQQTTEHPTPGACFQLCYCMQCNSTVGHGETAHERML